jgi:hypothetical protein
VDDSLAVRGVERQRDLLPDLQQLRERQRASLQALGQRLPFQQLHHQVMELLLPWRSLRGRGVADVVQRADVGMVQRGDGLRLALEALANLLVAGQHRGNQLDGDIAIQARIARAMDLPHAAGAERAEDLVGSESCSGR